MNRLLATIVFVIVASASHLVLGQKVFKSCGKLGQLAMTFDEGPSRNTGRLLDILDGKGVKAAFHVVPRYLDDPIIYANLVRAGSSGHLIGLRLGDSWDGSTSAATAVNDANTAASAIEGVVGYKPIFIRFPFTKVSGDVLAALINAGYIVTTYNLDSMDYSAGANVLQNFKNFLDALTSTTKGAFISVQRDIVDSSVSATPSVIDYVKSKGYDIVRLDECVGKSQGDSSSSDDDDASAPDGSQGQTHNGATQKSSASSTVALIAAILVALLAAF